MVFLKLIRYKNLFMVLLTMIFTKYVLIDSIVTHYFLTNLQFCILSTSVVFITMGGYIINDFFDIDTDVINKPHKVIIGRYISLKSAKYLYTVISLIGLFLGLYVSITSNMPHLFWIYLFCILSLFLYSSYFKTKFLLGNMTISILCSLTIILTYLFNSKQVIKDTYDEILLYNLIVGYSFFAFLTTFIRELIKDIEDVDGDLVIKAKTLPILVGRKRASRITFFFSCILLVYLLFVLQSFKYQAMFLVYGIIFILFPLVYFMYKLWFSEHKKDFSKLSSVIKIIMLFGIFSMILFKIKTLYTQ